MHNLMAIFSLLPLSQDSPTAWGEDGEPLEKRNKPRRAKTTGVDTPPAKVGPTSTTQQTSTKPTTSTTPPTREDRGEGSSRTAAPTGDSPIAQQGSGDRRPKMVATMKTGFSGIRRIKSTGDIDEEMKKNTARKSFRVTFEPGRMLALPVETKENKTSTPRTTDGTFNFEEEESPMPSPVSIATKSPSPFRAEEADDEDSSEEDSSEEKESTERGNKEEGETSSSETAGRGEKNETASEETVSNGETESSSSDSRGSGKKTESTSGESDSSKGTQPYTPSESPTNSAEARAALTCEVESSVASTISQTATVGSSISTATPKKEEEEEEEGSSRSDHSPKEAPAARKEEPKGEEEEEGKGKDSDHDEQEGGEGQAAKREETEEGERENHQNSPEGNQAREGDGEVADGEEDDLPQLKREEREAGRNNLTEEEKAEVERRRKRKQREEGENFRGMVTRELTKATEKIKRRTRGNAESSEEEEEDLDEERRDTGGRGCDSGLGMATLATTSMEESEEEDQEEVHFELNNLIERLEGDMEGIAEVTGSNAGRDEDDWEQGPREWESCREAINEWYSKLQSTKMPDKRRRETKEVRLIIQALRKGLEVVKEAMGRHDQFFKAVLEEAKRAGGHERMNRVDDLMHTAGLLVEARRTSAALLVEPEIKKQLSESEREAEEDKEERDKDEDDEEEEQD